MRKRTQKYVDDLSPQVQSELVRPYKAPSYEEHEYYQVPPPGVDPWEPPVFDPLPLPVFMLPTPTIVPFGGSYDTAINVYIACQISGVDIYYTLNGTTPTKTSYKYSSPIVLISSTTVKAIAVKDGWTDSGVSVQRYLIPSYFYPAANSDTLWLKWETGSYTLEPYNYWSGIYIGQNDASPEYGGDTTLRFKVVKIPNGVTILSASIDLFVYAGSQSSDIDVYGNDADNAVSPASVAEFLALSKTTAMVNWTTFPRSQSEFVTSPDITDIIQEVIDRPGWLSGNSLMLILNSEFTSPSPSGLVYAFLYKKGPVYMPRLSISWTTEAPPEYEWVDRLDNNYWTPTYGTWSTDRWVSEEVDVGGTPYQAIQISPINSWEVGYRPIKFRITHNFGSPIFTQISPGVYGDTYTSGTEEDITVSSDMTEILILTDGSQFEVTVIDFYSEV